MKDANSLAIDSLSLSFGGLTVLKDINFGVVAGEVLGLIGPNGAGKSALLNCISGLYTPERGSTITFDGNGLIPLKASHRAALGIKRTFQHIHLIDELTILDNVLLGLASAFQGGVFRRQTMMVQSARQERVLRSKAEAALELCGISAIGGERADALPLGIRRRVDLARALVSEPRLLLLDEPASGLASEERNLVRELVNIARRERDVAVIWIEHDLELVTSVATRILVLHHGRIVAQGDPRKAGQRDALIGAYLTGAPIQ
jgi:branched-chain amino acid transport system ATP-binding protein